VPNLRKYQKLTRSLHGLAPTVCGHMESTISQPNNILVLGVFDMFLITVFPPRNYVPTAGSAIVRRNVRKYQKKKHKEPHEINHFSAKQHGWESLTCFSWLFFLKPGANNRFCRCASNLGICNHSAQCKICITFNQNRWIG
jgi:hypothetical protein